MIKKCIMVCFFAITARLLFADQDNIEAFPPISYDRYIIYETLALFWIGIIGLVVIIRMKLKEINRIRRMGIDEHEKEVPLLD